MTDSRDDRIYSTWTAIILFGALTAMGPVGLDMYLPALPTIAAHLGASAAEAQASFATFLAGMAIGQLIYGPVSDRLGRKLPMIFGICLYIAGSIACALANSPEALIAGRFAQALGGCAGAVIARASIRDSFGHASTAGLFSLLAMIVGTAPILAPQIGAALLNFVDWRAIFWATALFGVGLLLSTSIWMRETRSAETATLARLQHPFATYMQLLLEARLLKYVVTGAFNGAIVFSYIAFSPTLLIQIYGFSPFQYATFFGTNALGMIAGALINRALIGKFTPEQILHYSVASCLMLCSVLLIFAVMGFPPGVLIALVCALATFGFIQGNLAACALNVDPGRAGSISALYGCLMFGGGGVGAWAVGAFGNGTPIPFAIVLCLLACGSAASYFLIRGDGQPQHEKP